MASYKNMKKFLGYGGDGQPAGPAINHHQHQEQNRRELPRLGNNSNIQSLLKIELIIFGVRIKTNVSCINSNIKKKTSDLG